MEPTKLDAEEHLEYVETSDLSPIEAPDANVGDSSEPCDVMEVEPPPKFSLTKDSSRPILLAQYPCSTNITRGCKFSPDGLCLLTNSEDNQLRIFETPNHSEDVPQELKPCFVMAEGELIYDFCWYPTMDSRNPDTCCFVSTAQYAPIHLYDAYDGHIRATYRCFDGVDEMVAAYSLAFDPHGQKLFAGLKNEIRIFDISIPGRDCEIRKTWTKQAHGPSGIISCIATSPALSEVYAVGTYGKSIGVYAEPGELICLLTGELYGTLERKVETNQRIQFDIRDDMVVSGGTDGAIRVWDLTQPPIESGKSSVIEPILSWENVHGGDCVNGITFNPYQSKIASSSGQRHFKDVSAEISSSEDEIEGEGDESKMKRIENSFKIWALGE
ncbi:hypothetical protein TCAL_09896 [Tigriopus californicus]|uniref:WD repeat-containing protein 79 n=1 Tax=Tigriopus californicus TaxID=6832 RepID=A0A553PQ06_TIGCA|nr:hypothetical protein TCAL_09896 [Tigriopus californicus]|eukprot:TCALIF_09896-PA protein Name:"Similar to Wrap53 Telomerase Cajal body protein 1 (Mesocricetus auratus)" AED:0.18 eAED:0.18 QI:0/0/0/1/1/1/4/0/384